MTRSRTEIARQSIDAWNRRDVPVSLQGFADRESALAAAGGEVRG